MTHLSHLFHLLLFLIMMAIAPPANSQVDSEVGLAGCEEKCGDVTIPYPFGLKEGCFRGGFKLTCNKALTPPKLFIDLPNVINSANLSAPNSYEVASISYNSSEVIIEAPIGRYCSSQNDSLTSVFLDFSNLPYVLSSTRNKFTVLGCEALALNSEKNVNFLAEASGCVSLCDNQSTFTNGTCSGKGCCQTGIPRGWKSLSMAIQTVITSKSTFQVSKCDYMFLVDKENYRFQSTDFEEFLTRKTAPAVLDWAIGNDNCSVASKLVGYRYDCGRNSRCVDSTNGPGYQCRCLSGYTGNPYLQDGCEDIDECQSPSTNTCSDLCTNTQGNYTCSCPSGTYGDGRKTGKGCIKNNAIFPLLRVVLGIGLSMLFLLVGGSWLYWMLKKRRMLKMKEKFFEQNGGLLLKQRMTSNGNIAQIMKIFITQELTKATDNYNVTMILGQGGQGTVYKGILPDERVVAIKKSVLLDKDQVEEFINEIIILSQTIHRNVVRLLGCCLESETPMLVYEFISNGTLYDHIHGDDGHRLSLPWDSRLRIGMEIAGAIDYLHTATTTSIFHRDIKSANILLNEDFTAKVSDFGVSRLVALDEVQVTTLVRGTLGYLDPVYFQTGQLTDKSDVYSFGVVLVELLTGEKSVSLERPEEDRNLAQYFLTSLKHNRLFEILDRRISIIGDREQLQTVAEIARECLQLQIEERPTMKEVAADLAKLRTQRHRKNHTISIEEEQEKSKEMESLLRTPLIETDTLEGHSSTYDDSTAFPL